MTQISSDFSINRLSVGKLFDQNQGFFKTFYFKGTAHNDKFAKTSITFRNCGAETIQLKKPFEFSYIEEELEVVVKKQDLLD